MEEEKKEPECEIDEKKVEEWFKQKFSKEWCKSHHKKGGMCHGGSGLYFVGFIGAAVYYISLATTFWVGVLAFLKALVWPAFLVYELLKFLGV